MGTGDIKYGDTFVFLQHMKTGLWLSYQTFETKKRGVGRVEEKKVRFHCDLFPAHELDCSELNYPWGDTTSRNL